MENRIKQLAMQYLPRMKEIRRYLHQNPELGHEEFLAQQCVIDVLEELGIEYTKVAGTGVLGIIHGGKPGKTVLLRADMDALPVEELADVPYKSLKEGLMHACGHDGHTAGLLGVAMVLNEIKAELKGTVKLMFQPAEETDGGALPMIQEGILENPKVDAAFGLHLGGDIDYGKIAVKEGPMMGAPDEFEIEIIGRGGHAAHPNQTIDPISIAVQFINNAQHILTRCLDPIKPAVVSFTTIHAGTGLNVIPESLKLGGTIRTLHEDIREQIPTLLERLLQSLCESYGAQYNFEFMPSYPPLVNDLAMTELLYQSMVNLLGETEVFKQEFPTLGAEDFAFVAKYVPASYYYVGIHETGKPMPVHHHPLFQWNDDILSRCCETLAYIAFSYLNQ